MAAYIGSVNFTYPLKWIDKNVPNVLGSDDRARDGSLISQSPKTISQTELYAEFRFDWEPYSVVETLRNMAKTRATYETDFEDTGETFTFRFAAKDGVTDVKHPKWDNDVVKADIEGYETDLWDGTIKGFIIIS